MSRRLPDGTYTNSDTVYLDAWHELSRPLENTYGWILMAFDPGFKFDSGGEVFNLSTAVVRTLSEFVVSHTK